MDKLAENLSMISCYYNTANIFVDVPSACSRVFTSLSVFVFTGSRTVFKLMDLGGLSNVWQHSPTTGDRKRLHP